MEEKPKNIEQEDIQLNSEREDIQRILGNPPGWALRWGITAIFFVVVLFMILGWIIKYPDVIQARTIIITENPPVRVFTRSSGKISQLFIADKSAVSVGQTLALMENTANINDIEKLEYLLSEFEKIAQPIDLMGFDISPELILGDLQNTFAEYQQAIQDFQFFERQRGVFARITSLEHQINFLADLNSSLIKQEKTLTQEVELAQKNLTRNKELLESGTISEVTYEQIETNYLQYRRQLENLQSQVLVNKLEMEQYRSQIIDLRQKRTFEQNQKWLGIRELQNKLKSELELWEQTYLVTSPIEGKVSLTRVWSPQQFVKNNEEIATIVPESENKNIIGRAFLPLYNSGKVQQGQRVNIQLDGYPYQEFGMLQGQVKEIALVPDQENYLMEIKLPNTLITTYNRSIPFAQELSGNARIITEDRRILERVFDQLVSLLRNN